MRFLLAIIYPTEIHWAGFEVIDSLPDSSNLLDAIRTGDLNNSTPNLGKILRIVETGRVPRSGLNSTFLSRPESDHSDETINKSIVEHVSGSDQETDSPVDPTLLVPKYPEEIYDTTLGIISSALYYSMEIDLPFSDSKKAEKVLSLQIQDQLPFDLPETHTIIYRSGSDPIYESGNVKNGTDNSARKYRYFYQAIPVQALQEAIDDCRMIGLNLSSLVPDVFIGNAFLDFLEIGSNTGTSRCLLTPDISTNFSRIISLVSSQRSKNQAEPSSLSNFPGTQTLHARNFSINGFETEGLSDSDLVESLSFRQLQSQIYLSLRCANGVNGETGSSGIPELEIIWLDTIGFHPERHHDNGHIGADIASTSLQQSLLKMNAKILYVDNFFETSEDLQSNLSPTVLIAAFCIAFDFAKGEGKKAPKDRTPSPKLFPNFMSGAFRYRAPLTEIKSSLLNEIVPLFLLLFFATLNIFFSFKVPWTERSMTYDNIQSITREVLPNQTVATGQEVFTLESKIIELEEQLGDLRSLQSLSPTEWLAKLSSVIGKEVDLELDSIAISTTGLTFRGLVPDYPTSGRVTSLLNQMKENEPERFCEVDLKTEDVAIGTSKKSILVEIKLCT